MPDRNPIRAEIQYSDGRVLETELHFAPPNGFWNEFDLRKASGPQPVFSVFRMRADGIRVMRDEKYDPNQDRL